MVLSDVISAKTRLCKTIPNHSKDESLFEGLDNLKAFKANFESLPKIASYIKSDKFRRGPRNNKMAKWGGDAELKKSW